MNKLITLLNSSSYFDQAIPFDKVEVSDFLPAAKEAFETARQRLKAIKETTAPPTFENTIVALEEFDVEAEQILNLYFNLFSAHGSPEIEALAQEMSLQSASFSNEVILDAELFARIKAVYESRAQLNSEQQRLVDVIYRDFADNGALVPSELQAEYRKISEELSGLSPQFSQNVLADTNAFKLVLETPADLAGLPEDFLEAAQMAATEKGLNGKWLVTLDYPSFGPFLKFSDRRDLREVVYRAFSSRGLSEKHNNIPVIKRTVELRQRLAQILGSKTYADHILQNRMAKSTPEVVDFLSSMAKKAKPAAIKEVEEMRAFARATDGIEDFKPWDWGYYEEKLRSKKLNFDEQKLRAYFKLENVINGAFQHASLLYNLQFTERKDLPVYHPDVRVYEVTEKDSTEYIGLFYTDFFPRETKKSGAWMTAFRNQGFQKGSVKRPHVSIVCNFTKPTATKPSLLTLDEVQTLFHEFGHALHGLLSKVTYKRIGGTNVLWDFVELPSQIMENWVGEKEGLQLFAKHFETGEMLPEQEIQKIIENNQFHAGYQTMRQLNFANLDMQWHTDLKAFEKPIEEFEKEATKDTQLLDRVPGALQSTAFSHIFAGGYAAGYYSYKWAEVLDADAFEAFLEEGIFNPKTAKRFKECILQAGNSKHPMELFKNFRGREPKPEALLKRSGLLA